MAKVGITMLKLTNGYGRGKRKGNLKAVACEGLEERYCSDEDYNAAATVNNVYEGIRSGEELTRVITEEAEAYSEYQKSKGKRALRKDAVIGFACIVKPSGDFINTLTPEERERFWDDSNAVMTDILGYDSGTEHIDEDIQHYHFSSIKARVRHKDEQNEHEHYYGMPYTKDGRLCGKEFFSLKTYKRFNSEYPRRMRALGWDIEDCTVYDEEQAVTDDGYKARHIKEKKAKGYGKSSKDYKHSQEIAKMQDTNDFLQERLNKRTDTVIEQDKEIAELTEENAKLKQELQKYKDREKQSKTMSKRSEQAQSYVNSNGMTNNTSRFDRSL